MGSVPHNTHKYRLLFMVSVGTIVLDQLTKWYMDATFMLHESVPVFENFFHITYIRNPGAAFGILARSSEAFRIPFFLTLSAVAVIGIILFYRTVSDRFTRLGLSLVLGGAVGNMIDRARLGEVIDFIDVHWYNHHWPAFNIADSAITVGVGFLILEMFLKNSNE